MSARNYIWEYSRQFKCQCAIPQQDETADAIIRRCLEVQAVVYEPYDPDGLIDEDEVDREPLFVVQLRPDVGPEVWTEAALRTSMEPKKEA